MPLQQEPALRAGNLLCAMIKSRWHFFLTSTVYDFYLNHDTGAALDCVFWAQQFFKKSLKNAVCQRKRKETERWLPYSLSLSLALALTLSLCVSISLSVFLSLPVFPGAVIMISTCGHGSWLSPALSPGLIITVLLYVQLPQEADWPLWLSVFSLTFSLWEKRGSSWHQLWYTQTLGLQRHLQ